MAVNLNPGADPTLVQAATNAAMADVPKDQGQIWQNMSIERGKAYQAWGEVGAQAANLFMQGVGGEMLEDAFKNSSLGRAYDKWQVQKRIDGELGKDFDKMMKDHKVMRDGGVLSDGTEIEGWRKIKDKEERKAAKREWNKQWRNNVAEFDMFEEGALANMLKASGGLVNIEATGGINSLKQGALQAKGGWFGKEEGNRVRIRSGRDADGNLEFYLESEKGGYITGVNADGSYEIETTYDDAGAVVTGGPKNYNVQTFPEWAIPKTSTDTDPDAQVEVTSQKTQLENLSKVVDNLPQSVKNALTNLPTSEEDITTLQNDLLSLGYKLPKWGADGEMGNETRGAVLDFKRDLDLVNNTVSQVTQKRLKITANDINGLVTTIDQKKRNALNQLDLDALSGKMPYRKNATANQVLDILGNDVNAWNDAFNARLANNDKTYAEMLREPSDLSATVFQSLANLGAVDADGKDGVDAKDFVGNSADVQRNMAIMTNTLLDPSNPLAKKAFADWYSDQVGKSALTYLENKEAQNNKKNNKNKKTKFTKKNAATIISMNDAGDGTTAAFGNKSPIDNLDVGVGDVVLSNDIIAGITGRKVDSETKEYSYDYKIGEDGVLYYSGKKGEERKWVESEINEEKYNDQYNKLVKYLTDNKIAAIDYKGVVTPEKENKNISEKTTQDLLNEDANYIKVTDARANFLKKDSDFNILGTKGGNWNKNSEIGQTSELSTYLFSYSDDDFVAGTLTRHFRDQGFTFSNTSKGGDGITATYIGHDGRSESKFFETNFINKNKDKQGELALRNWMLDMLKKDEEAIKAFYENL